MKRNRTIEQARQKKAQRIAARERRYDKLMQSRIVCNKRINKRHITRYRTHARKEFRKVSKEIRPGFSCMYFGMKVWMFRNIVLLSEHGMSHGPDVYTARPKCKKARHCTLEAAIYDREM